MDLAIAHAALIAAFEILSRRGSPATSLMRRVVLSCTGWSLDTSCTSVASTVRDVKGVGRPHLLLGASLASPGLSLILPS